MFIRFNSITHSFFHHHGSVENYPKNWKETHLEKYPKQNPLNHDCRSVKSASSQSCRSLFPTATNLEPILRIDSLASEYLRIIDQRKRHHHHACTPTSTAASSPTAMSWVPATLPPMGSPTSCTSKQPNRRLSMSHPGCLILFMVQKSGDHHLGFIKPC